jgi:hypothetical protein
MRGTGPTLVMEMAAFGGRSNACRDVIIYQGND